MALELRRHIESQQLTAGDRLPTEVELLEKHRVSRSVLREAVSRLESIGLIETRRGLGMYVGSQDVLTTCTKVIRTAMAISLRDLSGFGEFRGALERQAARRAAERARPEHVAELEALVDALDRTDLTYEQAIRIDFEFHRKLFEIAGNPLMQNVIEVLQELIVEGMLQTTPNPRDHDVSQRLHRAIVEAVRAGDADAADEAMRIHMDVTCARLAAYADQHRGAAVAGREGNGHPSPL